MSTHIIWNGDLCSSQESLTSTRTQRHTHTETRQRKSKTNRSINAMINVISHLGKFFSMKKGKDLEIIKVMKISAGYLEESSWIPSGMKKPLKSA